jgi:threonine dehydratase
MCVVRERMEIVPKPSLELPLAAISENKIDVKDPKTGIIISNGNFDFNHLLY